MGGHGEFDPEASAFSQGNPAAVPAIKTQAFDKASNAARTFAKSRVAVAAKGISKEVQEQAVAKQAQNIRQAERIFPGKSFFRRAIETIGEAQMVSLPPSLPGPKNKEQGTETPKPRNLKETLEKQKALPASEWDVVPLPPVVVKALFRGSEIKRNAVDLEDMAKRADNEEARRYYGVAKSVAGFTPEEIKAEKTKHGVTFNAALIDPKSVTVFRSVAELNKHWHDGQPDEVFLETGDSVDPRHTLTTQEFYLAQLALLSRK